MIEVRLHEELYDRGAIDEAIATYGAFATVDSTTESGRFVLRISALPAAIEGGVAEGTICAELVNYALGKSVERSRSAGAAR